MIRTPHRSETDALVQLAIRSGLFAPREADMLLRSTLDALHHGTLPGRHLIRVVARGPDDTPLGWSYAAESTVALGVWDVWWIGVDPVAHGSGVGTELLAFLEYEMRAANARTIVIETSDGQGLARARRFYHSRGYLERGRIPDFYALGEAKIIFSKTIGAFETERLHNVEAS